MPGSVSLPEAVQVIHATVLICFFHAFSKIISDECEKAVKAKEAEWKVNRPAGFVGSGSYPSKTKEEIMAIKDPIERQKAIAENISLFQ